MTEKELRRLSRADLLELLLAQMKENVRLQDLLDEKETQLESRRIEIEKAGSIAEASLKLNHVFTAAQMAADQYLDNIRRMHYEAELEYRARKSGRGGNTESETGCGTMDQASGSAGCLKGTDQ